MVLSFNDRVVVDSELTTDRDRLIRAVSQVRPGPNARLYDAVSLACSERLRRVSARKAMVLLTDGVDTASGLASAESTAAQIEQGDVPFMSSSTTRKPAHCRRRPCGRRGTAPDSYRNRSQLYAQGTEYLRRLAEGSGGTLTYAESLDAVREAFLQVARELTHQYTICYYPANPARDGSLRRIRVAVENPDLVVRARSSYRAGNK